MPEFFRVESGQNARTLYLSPCEGVSIVESKGVTNQTRRPEACTFGIIDPELEAGRPRPAGKKGVRTRRLQIHNGQEIDT